MVHAIIVVGVGRWYWLCMEMAVQTRQLSIVVRAYVRAYTCAVIVLDVCGDCFLECLDSGTQ